MVYDGGLGVEHAVAELVGAETLPNVPDRVQFRAVRRQVQQGDIVWHAQASAGLAPARAIADQQRTRPAAAFSPHVGQRPLLAHAGFVFT